MSQGLPEGDEPASEMKSARCLDAVFAAADEIAIGAIHAMSEANIDARTKAIVGVDAE